jgi:hypothetical protein
MRMMNLNTVWEFPSTSVHQQEDKSKPLKTPHLDHQSSKCSGHIFALQIMYSP